MNPLADILKARIARDGPISLMEYMQTCLGHPEHGYYTTRDPLGAAGDFTTAPEISQMFGELLGLWLAQVWQDQGAPSPFILAELGPGRGTLMADILRATAKVHGFAEAAQVWLVETSPTLRAKQADAVPVAHWCDSIDGLSEGPLFTVANEFFDALPIRQFQRTGAKWHERMVGLEADALSFGLGPALAMPLLDARHPKATEGMIAEIAPMSEGIARALGARIATAGGVLLAVDYGDWAGSGDTFQALTAHAFADPLSDPGNADLTAHVGFGVLAEASVLRPHFTTQGAFLERLGITARANQLADLPGGEAVVAAHRRLTHPDEMGRLFKVLALCPEAAPPPPGFE